MSRLFNSHYVVEMHFNHARNSNQVKQKLTDQLQRKINNTWQTFNKMTDLSFISFMHPKARPETIMDMGAGTWSQTHHLKERENKLTGVYLNLARNKVSECILG